MPYVVTGVVALCVVSWLWWRERHTEADWMARRRRAWANDDLPKPRVIHATADQRYAARAIGNRATGTDGSGANGSSSSTNNSAASSIHSGRSASMPNQRPPDRTQNRKASWKSSSSKKARRPVDPETGYAVH